MLIPIVLVYAAMSLFTFVAYGIDKGRARRGQRRIPERTLHGLGLAGGWPGALLGQSVFRHKRQKGKFVAVTVATAVVHSAGWAWWAATR